MVFTRKELARLRGTPFRPRGILLWILPLVLLWASKGALLAEDLRGRIVFHVGTGSKINIALLELPELKARDLTERRWTEGNPSFSPRGDRIAFQRDGDIWGMDADGGRPQNLTRTAEYEGCPWFSGDGQWIAFDGIRGDRSDIFLMRSDGGEMRRLREGPGNNACPAFRPDGKAVAYLSDRDGQMELYLLDLESGKEKRLTQDPGDDMDPAFSPDGRAIAFVSNRRGKFELYEMNADGGGLQRLTEAEGFDIQPSYSPDGDWIAIERDGRIVAVNRNSGEIRPIGSAEGYRGGPSWGP